MTETLQGLAGAGGQPAEALAVCALASVPGIGAGTLARIARAFGSLGAALQAGPEALAARAVELKLRRRTTGFLARRPDLEKLGAWAVSAARSAGARAVTLADPSYPRLLRAIENPPPVLYVRGDLSADSRRVALVGARAADDPALQLSRELGQQLAIAGVEVVSGGARGVDAEAHAGALWGGGRTVAVLGSGIDVAYPPEHGALFERIAAGGGALVSELPPGTPATRPNFPRRNRTIAGLSHATVVVRATAESGALITAQHARAQGRPVFAVPGEEGEALTAGPRLLFEAGEAAPVTCARDILELLGWPVPGQLAARKEAVAPSSRPSAAPAPAPRAVEQALEGAALCVWKLLDGQRPIHVDVLAARARLATHDALRWLTELELKGLIHQRPGKYFLRSRGWS